MYQNPEESMISGNAITVLNASEVLSMELPAQAVLMPMANGWNMVVQQDCRITVTFRTGARRLEIQLVRGDEIYRDHQDIIISRKSPVQTERRYRAAVGVGRYLTETTGAAATSAQPESSYTPPDYSELIQQVRQHVMQDLERMMREAQKPPEQPSEQPPEGGEPQES
ncbi:TPA: hypothetical protein EYP37_02095 [Candidatus Poribacteria bacterium]|nr:hypothetical protein [Candidatus Poribacteria bacterium]